MPGVIDGQPYWDEKDSQIRGISSQSHQRAMSPYHHGDEKFSSRSHHSNGYGSDHHSEPSEDGATYLLEHLATFSVGTKFGLMAPEDGLRRLLQMEKSNGIWTQKMQMRLERNWVIIIDYENGAIVERFPMSLISDPTACSDGRREFYNNILIFIVKGDPKSKNHSPSEMHIFQCAQVSAQDIVDEIKMFMSGKSKSRYKDNMRQLPPPPSNPPPDPPVNGVSGISVREQVNMFNAAAAAANTNYSPHREANYSQQRIERSGRGDLYVRESNDETNSTASDKYEQDVAILNHCFDDIERFIARLQHAAAAYKELERRQKSRKNKKKDMGDGMLSIRAKPPPEREFIDILQKFKLSFNLLAKLRSHIHDPNAPELVHFLFTPLALIIDAAKDSNYSSNLASRVVTPLLTREAIELLTNCCTSKETDLWHSLGEPWVIPRDMWKEYDREYHPVFSDGWAPEYPNFDERDPSELAAAAAPISNYHRSEAIAEERDYHHAYSREDKSGRYDGGLFYSHDKHGNHNHGSPSGIADRHSHSIYESRQFEEHDETNRRDFSSERDARFPPLERDVRDRDVRSDFSADSIEHISGSDPHKQFEWQQQQWLEELKSQDAKIVQVVYPRTANNDKELTVIRGEYLEVLDDSRKWWKARNMRGQVAHVPHTIITPFNSNNVENEIFNNPIYATKGSPRENSSESPIPKGNFEDITTSSQESPSRRPASIPTPASADWVRRERQGKKDSITDQTHQKISLAVQTDDDDNIYPITPPNSLENKNRQFSLKESMGVQTDDDDDIKPILPEDIFKTHTTTTTTQDRNVKEYKAKQTDIKNELNKEPVKSKIKLEKLLMTLEKNWDETFESWETPVINKPVKEHANGKLIKEITTVEPVDAKEAQKQLQKEIEINKPFSLGSKVNKKWICPKHNKSSCSYLKLHSNSSEVKHWLEVKGFSEKSQVILDSLNGDMLFSLKKDQLEKYLGEEGCRLYSHLLIQRNISGVKTTRSEELRNILEQRRKLTDENENENSSSTISLELEEDEKIDKEITAKLLQFLAKQTAKTQ